MQGLKLHFVHLYPDLMNLYGDRGNMVALAMRAKWRGISTEVREVSLGENLQINKIDCIVMGGGQGSEQRIISKDLLKKNSGIHYCAEKGIPILAICGGFQLLGKYYLTAEGEILQGLNLLDMWTVAGKKRMIGNIAIRAKLGRLDKTIVGFENHVGKTFLGAKTAPLGMVLKGSGNNGQDGKEGAVYKNVIGTYLHGPLLPKNPWLTDYLLEKALKRKYTGIRLQLLSNQFEKRAHEKVLKRLSVKL